PEATPTAFDESTVASGSGLNDLARNARSDRNAPGPPLEANAERHQQIDVPDVAVIERIEEIHEALIKLQAKAHLRRAATKRLLQVSVDRAEVTIDRVGPVADLGKLNFRRAEPAAQIKTRPPEPAVAAVRRARQVPFPAQGAVDPRPLQRAHRYRSGSGRA